MEELICSTQSRIDGKIAEWLRVRRIDAQQLAMQLDMTPVTLSSKRLGKSEWKLSELLDLCDLLDLSLGELTGVGR